MNGFRIACFRNPARRWDENGAVGSRVYGSLNWKTTDPTPVDSWKAL